MMRNRLPAGARTPLLFASILAAILSVVAARQVVLTLAHPYPIEYGEGVTLLWTLRADAGKPLYPRPSADPPYLHNPYTPLFYRLAAGAGELFPTAHPFAPGRMLSLLGTALAALSIFVLVKKRAGKAFAAAACFLFTLSPVTLRFCCMERVDMIGLGLAAAGLVILDRECKAGCVAAGILAAAAFLVKPTFIVSGIAMLCFCADGKRLRSVLFLLGFVPVATGAFLVLLARGETGVAAHLLRMNALPMTFRQAFDVIAAVGGRHAIVLGGIGLCLAAGRRRKGLLWWYSLVSLLCLPLAAKTGSQENYLLETIFAACACAGMAGSLAAPRARPLLPWLLTAQLIIYIPVKPAAVFTRTYGQELSDAGPAGGPSAAEREMGELVVSELRRAQSPVLCENVGYVLLAGKKPVYQPYQHAQLALSGRWSDERIVEMIRGREFGIIVLEADAEAESSQYFTAPMLQAIAEEYRVKRLVGRYRVMEPAS